MTKRATFTQAELVRAIRAAEAVPGPWEAAMERGCHGVIAHTLPSGGANFVALVGNPTDTPEKEPSRFANARLIAMAPVLAAENIALREREARLVEALAAAMYACRVVDEAVKEGHQSLPALVNHFLQAVEPARAALAEIEKEDGE